ncbi:MAG: hypothetical protein M8353_08750 [ANME-2 cluster archaeon]|nr:hypothetical protein [ANME-2 cluster archaeon]
MPGFLFFASMMGEMGAMSGPMRESQQFNPIFTFPAVASHLVHSGIDNRIRG